MHSKPIKLNLVVQLLVSNDVLLGLPHVQNWHHGSLWCMQTAHMQCRIQVALESNMQTTCQWLPWRRRHQVYCQEFKSFETIASFGWRTAFGAVQNQIDPALMHAKPASQGHNTNKGKLKGSTAAIQCKLHWRAQSRNTDSLTTMWLIKTSDSTPPWSNRLAAQKAMNKIMTITKQHTYHAWKIRFSQLHGAPQSESSVLLCRGMAYTIFLHALILNMLVRN